MLTRSLKQIFNLKMILLMNNNNYELFINKYFNTKLKEAQFT